MADVRTHNPGRRSGVAEAIARALEQSQKPTAAAAPPQLDEETAPAQPSVPVGLDPTMPLSVGWDQFVIPAKAGSTGSASEGTPKPH